VLEFVIEAMVDAVVVVDADGRITLANSGAEQLTSYARDELCAMHVSNLLFDDRSGIEEGNVLRREESWLLTKDGARVPVSVTGSPVLDGAGALHGIVLVARDVREVRRLLGDREAEIERRRIAEDALRTAMATIEEKLEQTRTQLLLAERRATLGTLAGGVGHELRNIAQIQIAAVDELANAIRENEDVAAMARRVLPDLERVGDHITQHGHRLMQLAHPGPDEVTPISISVLVRDVAAMLELAGKLGQVDLVLALPPDAIKVNVNRTRIEQIFVNLIINAVDATAGGGTVRVEVVQPAQGGRVVCTVADTGTGIAADMLEKIFEPFFTTKGEHGTGLGLPVVREIVTSYGGTLNVSSATGAGTTFTFDLPC
jgi:PAS domain S-box-containing protein